MYLAEHQDDDLAALVEWVEREQPVAIGERGRDYFLPELGRERQQALFVAQIRKVRELDMPLIIHARRAVDDVCNHGRC